MIRFFMFMIYMSVSATTPEIVGNCPMIKNKHDFEKYKDTVIDKLGSCSDNPCCVEEHDGLMCCHYYSRMNNRDRVHRHCFNQHREIDRLIKSRINIFHVIYFVFGIFGIVAAILSWRCKYSSRYRQKDHII
jgi:hypothetical protein